MWRCWWTRRALSAYHDGELSGWSARYVEQHVRACVACGQELDDLRRVAEVLRSLPGPSRPHTYWPQAQRMLQGKIRQVSRARAEARAFDYLTWMLDNPVLAMLPVTVLGVLLVVTLTVLELEQGAVTLFSVYLLPLILD